MGSGDDPIRRAGLLVLLVMLAVIALRGHLPGAVEPPVGEPRAGGGLATLVVVLVLCESAALFIMLGVVGGRRKRPRSAAEPARARGRAPRITRRQAALVAAIVLVSLVGLGAPMFVSRPTYEHNRSTQSPATAQRQPGAQPTAPRETVSDTPVVIAGAVLLVGIAVLGTVVLAVGPARRAGEPGVPDAPRSRPAVSGLLARAAELGLAEVAEPGRDPRAAIIACYSAMERGLAEAPDSAPLASDTPSEVLARAVEHGALHSDAAAHLVEVFTEARFSPHRMTETHRESAVEWLRTVLDDLRSRS